MKKKKVIFDSFSFGSGTGSAGWNLFRSLCTGSGCSNFQKADRICEKKAEAGTITIRTEKKLPAGTKVLQEISTISARPVQPKPEF